MAKKKKVSSARIAMFAVGMVIGLGLIIFDQFETIEGIISGTETTGLAILTVPIDPTTGGILGTIVLGAPDIVPFEQAGTMIGIPRVLSFYPRSLCTANVDSNNNLLPPDFGQRLSGERNQLNPVWWGSRDTGVINARDCAFAYAQFDIVDIPNEFVATSAVLKLEVLSTRGVRNTNNPPQSCTITIQDFNIDTIADEGVMNQIWRANALAIAGGTWCNGLGVKSFQIGQAGIDLINDAISGGAFDQGVRSDKLLLGFMPTLLNNLGTGKNSLSTEYWKTQGSLFLTGSSPPIKCSVGFNQVDFRCIPIMCDEGMRVNATTNDCEQIMCAGDEELLGNICTPIICNVGESAIGGACIPIQCGSSDQLVGSECIPLICDVGFEAKQNECILKTCGTGFELNQDTCQAIVCPSNTILNGNDCIERSCPIGQISVNNECTTTLEFEVVNVNDPSLCPSETVQVIPLQGDGTFDCMVERSIILQCGSGTQQVGDSCLPIDLSCPEGTVPQQNVCVQFLPDLMISQAPELGFVSILGIVIFGGSMFGLVGATRRV